MTKFHFFKLLGGIDEKIIEEVSNVPFKKHRKLTSITAIAACTLILFGTFIGYKILHKNATNNTTDKSIAQNIVIEPTPDAMTLEQLLDTAKVNKIVPLHSTAKLGGKLKIVTKKQWKGKYGTEDFVDIRKNKYLFSYGTYYKKNKILYGMLNLKLSTNKIIQIIVHDKSILYHPYTNLKTTLIGNYEVAICQKGISNWGAIIYGNNDIFYVFETHYPHTKKQFLKLLLEILTY